MFDLIIKSLFYTVLRSISNVFLLLFVVELCFFDRFGLILHELVFIRDACFNSRGKANHSRTIILLKLNDYNQLT